MARVTSLSLSVGYALLQNKAVSSCYLTLITLGYLLLQYLYNPSVFYNSIGWLDPFVYVGYGLYYSFPDFLDSYYKVSRLPWDILEFTARQSFRPGSAAFFLQFFCFSLMSISVFFGFRRLIGGSIALLLAIVSIFFPLFHAYGGADYHNTISGPLYFLMLALVVSAIAGGSLLFAGLAGVAAALALHTNPLIALLGPGLALHGLAYCRSHQRSTAFMLSAFAISLVGFAVGTVGLGAISAAFGRGFLFFMPQVDYLLWVRDRNTQWAELSWARFVASQPNAYLIGIFVLCLVELAILAVRRRFRDELETASAYGSYIVTYVLAAAFQLRGQGILEPEYLNHAFVVATWVPLGYLMQRYLPPLSHRSLAVLAGLLPAACAFVLLDSGAIYTGSDLNSVAPLTLVSLTLAGIYLGLVVFRGTRINLTIVWLPTLILAMIPSLSSYTYDACRATEHLNIFISDASGFATRIAGKPQRVYVFAEPKEQMAEPCYKNYIVFDLASSLTELGHHYLGDLFNPRRTDQLTRDDFAALMNDNGKAALLAVEDATKDRFLEIAAKLGVDLQVAGLFPDSVSGVTLYLFSTTAREFHGPSASLPLESLQPQNGGSLAMGDGAAVLTTSAQQWNYATSAPLPQPEHASGPAMVKVRLRVEQGTLGIGVLARGDSSKFLVEKSVDVTSKPVDVRVDLSDAASAGLIVFRSWSPNGVSVRARIISIETVLELKPLPGSTQR